MTIDEQITFCVEKAKNIKLKTEPQTFVDIKASLEELKMLRAEKERIIAELEKLHFNMINDLCGDCDECKYNQSCSMLTSKEYHLYIDKAIEIVKGGGVDE